jgi:hypothetical protein
MTPESGTIGTAPPQYIIACVLELSIHLICLPYSLCYRDLIIDLHPYLRTYAPTIHSRVDRGFRCQYSSALGPYEGGLAFGHK